MVFGNGYGDYGGYGGYGGSPYGPIAGSSFLPPYYSPGMGPGGPGQDEFVGISKKKKKTGLEGFLKGIYNGAVNTVKGIFSVQGIAMTAATAGLVWATGGAALLPLAALGAGIGGFQMIKGIAKGDAEGVGEGVFTTGASLLGLKFTPKTASLGGKSYTLTGEGEKLGLLGRLKSVWGGSKYKAADGETLNVWQMGAAKLQSRFQPKSAAKIDSYDYTAWKTRNDVENTHTLKMGQKQFREAYAKALDELENPMTVKKDTSKQSWWKPKKEVEYREKTALERKQDVINLELLRDKAGLPKQSKIMKYLGKDDEAQANIRALKLERKGKQLINAPDAEIDAINTKIKLQKEYRADLINELKKDAALSREKRLAFMQDAEQGPVDPKTWKYQLQDDISSVDSAEFHSAKTSDTSSMIDGNVPPPPSPSVSSQRQGAIGGRELTVDNLDALNDSIAKAPLSNKSTLSNRVERWRTDTGSEISSNATDWETSSNFSTKSGQQAVSHKVRKIKTKSKDRSTTPAEPASGKATSLTGFVRELYKGFKGQE